ncbi:MAG: hypothetical protein KOO62_08990 [candidate division Zixibacteria bacterium]|nr:hypothetical protein [candidate division Zixibacteria bacterium]
MNKKRPQYSSPLGVHQIDKDSKKAGEAVVTHTLMLATGSEYFIQLRKLVPGTFEWAMEQLKAGHLVRRRSMFGSLRPDVIQAHDWEIYDKIQPEDLYPKEWLAADTGEIMVDQLLSAFVRLSTNPDCEESMRALIDAMNALSEATRASEDERQEAGRKAREAAQDYQNRGGGWI